MFGAQTEEPAQLDVHRLVSSDSSDLSGESLAHELKRPPEFWQLLGFLLVLFGEGSGVPRSSGSGLFVRSSQQKCGQFHWVWLQFYVRFAASWSALLRKVALEENLDLTKGEAQGRPEKAGAAHAFAARNPERTCPILPICYRLPVLI